MFEGLGVSRSFTHVVYKQRVTRCLRNDEDVYLYNEIRKHGRKTHTQKHALYPKPSLILAVPTPPTVNSETVSLQGNVQVPSVVDLLSGSHGERN